MSLTKQIGRTTLEIRQGDLTTFAGDAIVNAANTFLAHGGGLALAIVKRGGQTIQEESDAIVETNGPLDTGEAVITNGGLLPAKYVIHAAGPIWSEKSSAEADKLLCAAVGNSLKLADEKGLESIALPALSTGIYHFPIDRAAKLMLAETKKYLQTDTGLTRVVYYLYDDVGYAVFADALGTI